MGLRCLAWSAFLHDLSIVQCLERPFFSWFLNVCRERYNLQFKPLHHLRLGELVIARCLGKKLCFQRFTVFVVGKDKQIQVQRNASNIWRSVGIHVVWSSFDLRIGMSIEVTLKLHLSCKASSKTVGWTFNRELVNPSCNDLKHPHSKWRGKATFRDGMFGFRVCGRFSASYMVLGVCCYEKVICSCCSIAISRLSGDKFQAPSILVANFWCGLLRTSLVSNECVPKQRSCFHIGNSFHVGLQVRYTISLFPKVDGIFDSTWCFNGFN